jgi:hypothetical protein
MRETSIAMAPYGKKAKWVFELFIFRGFISHPRCASAVEPSKIVVDSYRPPTTEELPDVESQPYT